MRDLASKLEKLESLQLGRTGIGWLARLRLRFAHSGLKVSG